MFELAAEIVFHLIGGFFYALFGALVGVLWPPKSATWARKQRLAITLGLSSLAAYALCFGLAYFQDWGKFERLLLLLASLLLICYLIVGNSCRRFHETAHAQENSNQESDSTNNQVDK